METRTTGIDWLTLTAMGGLKSEKLYSFIDVVGSYPEIGHLKPKKCTLRGMPGLRLGPVTVCKKPDFAMLQCYGTLASRIFNDPRLTKWDGNVTRVDLCIDVHLDERREIGVETIEMYEKWLKDGLRESSGRIVTGFDGGHTIYLKEGKNPNEFGRVYDKGVQLQDECGPEKWWRFEVQIMGEKAKKVADYLWASPDLPKACALYTGLYFKSRGLQFAFLEAGGIIKLESVSRIYTPEKSIEWLRTTVRSSLDKLIRAGYQDEAMNALGVQPTLWLQKERE